ncbi:S-adenosyl-L-methionine-dependent methyltransferases superfamily protein [Theobroma cacao]|uniref:S-adenosyl-L-methionine-dependent methyltransferases superfamily protein n=1 Tax=Theobroma cacao TaxID=3641 RepID=A0A061DYL2_THECC|nr:S-adenosyl-L-methionine-dependent methyltransferases superfamily protein [Theobroma cacao]
MECLLRFACSPPPPTAIVPPSLPFPLNTKKKRNGWLFRAKLSDDNDPLLQSAMDSASLRFHETHRPEPLFVDLYAGCFAQVPSHTRIDLKKRLQHYCIATKFIDDKLLRAVNHMDGLKQVVLLSDGMDTRPYRLNWPSSTIIFDISPERVFQKAAEKLKGVGAKIPRSCLYLHVPLESSNIQETLGMKGFNGHRPSIWAIQGLPVMTLASFEEILFLVSGMAMNGCLFLGELPAWLAETELGTRSSTEKWMGNLFMSNGFNVEIISYNEIAKSLGKEVVPRDYGNVLFVAEQLRFSDDQMETWRRELQRVEEDGDEEGFEEL